MSGWKTNLAGGLSILYGIGHLVLTNGTGVGEAIPYIVGGLGAVGLGHKVDKVKEAVWGPPPPPPK
jgi:hypothetical protein